MVRVISCHHFVSQDVFISEHEPSALGCAQGKLLLATMQHNIEVHDLDAKGNILHSFPTVDLVKQLVYCDIGNYVATLEWKSSRYAEPATFVRIYFNWWVEVKGQTMRVRIAGCSTPFEQYETGCFEMVELPLEQTSLTIACCKRTACLAVSLGKSVSLYCFHAKTDSILKRKFYDFDHLLNIEMSFIVEELNICEGYFACLARNQVQVFKVDFEKKHDNENSGNYSNEKADVTDEANANDTECLIWTFESIGASTEYDIKSNKQLKTYLHSDSFPLAINFPAIDRERRTNASFGNCEILGPQPSTGNHGQIHVRIDPKIFEVCPALVSVRTSCYTLLYKQIITSENQGYLSGLNLIPLYQSDCHLNENSDPLNAASDVSERDLFTLPWSPLISCSYSQLKSVCCFFTTSQEGFLYDVTSTVKMLCSYPYTAPLKNVILEPTLLHALTDAGLETYTLPVGHCAVQHSEDLDQLRNASPGYETSVCLLGLRPFLGVEQLIMCESYIVLISSTDDSLSNSSPLGNNSCTLYSLRRPSPEQLFADLLEVGQFHKHSSPPTYLHLLSEAHMILRTYLFINKHNQPVLKELFDKSCIMMADYYLCSDHASEKFLAIPYYFMGKLPLEKVIQRVLELSHQGKHAGMLKVLVRYLNLELLTDKFHSSHPVPQAIAESILDIYAEHSPEFLWKVILVSGLSGYRIEKAILILKRRITSKHNHFSSSNNAADTVAIVVLLLQKGNYEAAQSMILSVPKVELLQVLIDVCDLVWKDYHHSSLGQLIKQKRPDIFLELLLHLIEKRKLEVHDAIEFLKNESPEADISMIPLLKGFLETYISDKKFCVENNTAYIISLVTIYLNRLREPRKVVYTKTSTSIASSCKSALLFGPRALWLDEMPPFNGKGISKICVSTITQKSENEYCLCWTCNDDLLRLQSLLTWQQSTTAVTEHVSCFLNSLNFTIRGHYSLEVLCSKEPEALSLLLKVRPTAVLTYAYSVLGKNNENWHLLFSLITNYMENSSDDHLFKTYGQIFHGVMNHLSEILEPPAFISLLQGCQKLKLSYVSYVKRCCEKQQAELLKNKIVSLGKEIKDMM